VKIKDLPAPYDHMGEDMFSNKDPFMNSFVATPQIENDMQQYRDDFNATNNATDITQTLD